MINFAIRREGLQEVKEAAYRAGYGRGFWWGALYGFGIAGGCFAGILFKMGVL